MISLSVTILWLGLVLFWGGFWRCDQRISSAQPRDEWPSVACVIPARNEEETIAAVIASHARTDYEGSFRLFVVDDHSTDRTGDIVAQAEHTADPLSAPDLPPGWTGKLWALNHGIGRACDAMPDAKYLLLTDADIVHAPETLRKLVSKAETDQCALVSLMARLDARGVWGALLIPAFIFFFQKLYPFRWVNNPKLPVAGAAGGCVLVRVSALEAIGGLAALRGALIDDCTLAAKVKRRRSGNRIWLGLATTEVVSLRDNRSLASISHMVARTAFSQLHHSWILLALCVVGMGFVYAAPVALMCLGIAQSDPWLVINGAAAYALMTFTYMPTIRLYRLPLIWAGLLPISAALYTVMTIGSALRHLRGQGGHWKERTYPDG